MPKLSVIDLAMFLLETPERPFNIGPLVLLRRQRMQSASPTTWSSACSSTSRGRRSTTG